jgi:hypothetical protein
MASSLEWGDDIIEGCDGGLKDGVTGPATPPSPWLIFKKIDVMLVV